MSVVISELDHKSRVNLGGSNFLEGLQEYSGANIVEQMHEEECIFFKDLTIGSLLIVPESLYCDSELAQGVEKRGSKKNVLSLANWNDCFNESDQVYSLGFDILSLCHTIQSSTGQCNDASTSKVRKKCGGYKHSILWNIMG